MLKPQSLSGHIAGRRQFRVHQICHHVSKVLERWAAQAVQTDCPTVQSTCLDRWRPVPMISLSAEVPRRYGLRTCLPDRLFGLLGISMRFNPTPIAPELTRTTLCPASFSCTTVSTRPDRVDSSGWWVVSWTIDEVPAWLQVSTRPLAHARRPT